MSDVGGTYDFVAQTPMGEQTGTFTVVPSDDGTSFTGQLSGGMGSMDVDNGQIDGNVLTWKMKMSMPMPMTLEFTATVDGDAINGTVKLGAFGEAELSGTRAS